MLTMMGRAWLYAVFLVGAFSGAAHAKKAAPCECVQTRSYPELDSYDVPTNQKAIEINPWNEAEPFKITSLGELEPDTDYHFDTAPFLRFRTGKGPDWHPPSAPKQLHPSITIRKPFGADRYDTQTSITLWGDSGDDARFLEVFVEQDGQKAHFGMGAWNPQLCGQPLRGLSPGPAKITVWAIDRAGQRSAEPWTGEVTINGVDYDPTGGDCNRRHHYRCGTGMVALLLVIPVFYIGALLVLFVMSAIRRSRIRNTPGDHVSIPLGESVARIAARTYLIKLMVSMATVVALWHFELHVTSVLISPLVILWFVDVLRARRVVDRLEAPVNRLERREDWLLVDHTLLYCGRRAWNRASDVPAASVTKR
jgi:hypothetical protein